MSKKLESLQECFGGELNFWSMASTTCTLEPFEQQVLFESDYLSYYPERTVDFLYPDRNGI